MWLLTQLFLNIAAVKSHTEFDSVQEIQKSSMPYIKDLNPENFDSVVIEQFRDYYKELEDGTDSGKIMLKDK